MRRVSAEIHRRSVSDGAPRDDFVRDRLAATAASVCRDRRECTLPFVRLEAARALGAPAWIKSAEEGMQSAVTRVMGCSPPQSVTVNACVKPLAEDGFPSAVATAWHSVGRAVLKWTSLGSGYVRWFGALTG